MYSFSMNLIQIPSRIETYSKDLRLPINEIYSAYNRLVQNFGWSWKLIYNHPLDEKRTLPSIVLTTSNTGEALWILAGVIYPG